MSKRIETLKTINEKPQAAEHQTIPISTKVPIHEEKQSTHTPEIGEAFINEMAKCGGVFFFVSFRYT